MIPIRVLAFLAAAFLAAACSAPSARFPHGVASGDMAADSAVLWTRASRPATLVPEISTTPGFEWPHILAPTLAGPASDFTAKTLAFGLEPGTRYYYRFRSGRSLSPVGTFRTAYAPTQAATVRMAFTGDADWRFRPYPILSAIARENLDYFVFLGDLIYEWGDSSLTSVADDLEGYRTRYRENREPRPGSPSQATPMLDLYATVGHYSVFDNHETGHSLDPEAPPYNTGGATYRGGFVNKTEGHRARMRAYREYQPVREEEITGTGDARTDGTHRFYRSYSWGANVELIVLDDRSYRDALLKSSADPAAGDCKRTMLGPVQLAWAEQALLAAKRRGAVWKVVVVSSPMQAFGGPAEIGTDMDGIKSWIGAYRCERDKLLGFIDANGIDNVVFLTTDNHYTAVNNLDYSTVPGDRRSPRRPARNAFEIMTGPLGAGTGITPYGRKVGVEGLSRREADRKILSIWHGDAADGDGRTLGLKGTDRIGLEPSFPGLDVASIRSQGGAAGVVDPLAFASFRSFSYAVLTFDASRLLVEVKSMPSIPDP
jgi:phosphodiesterase/alkaline phosphatase D-like protein